MFKSTATTEAPTEKIPFRAKAQGTSSGPLQTTVSGDKVLRYVRKGV